MEITMEIPMILPLIPGQKKTHPVTPFSVRWRRFTEFPLDLDHPHPARRWKFGWLWDLQKLENVGKTIGKSTEDPNEFDEKSYQIIMISIEWPEIGVALVLRQSLVPQTQRG